MTTATETHKPQILTREYQEHGIFNRERYIDDENWEIIDTYTPCSSVTPWDAYGVKHQRELMSVFADAGIECIAFDTYRRIISPFGTGPGGRVRFGDDMMPSTYMIAIPKKDKGLAIAAIEQFRRAVHAWLYEKGPMPKHIG